MDETGVCRSCKDSSVVLLSSFSLVDQEAVVVGAIGDSVAIHCWKGAIVVVGMVVTACVCVDKKNCHCCVRIKLPLDAVSSLPLGLPPSSQISYFVAVVAKAFACVSNRCRAIVAFNGT